MRIKPGYMLRETEDSRVVVAAGPSAGSFQGMIRLNRSAAMLYRIKGEGGKQAVTDTLEYISPVIAELADMYGKVERGEVDLFKTDGK